MNIGMRPLDCYRLKDADGKLVVSLVPLDVQRRQFPNLDLQHIFSPKSGQIQACAGPADSSGIRCFPVFPTQPIRLAGTPATSAKSATSSVTTAPAAIITQRPMFTGARQTEPAPIEAPSSTVTPTGVQSFEFFCTKDSLIARGRLSFVRIAPGPTKTPFPSVAGS